MCACTSEGQAKKMGNDVIWFWRWIGFVHALIRSLESQQRECRRVWWRGMESVFRRMENRFKQVMKWRVEPKSFIRQDNLLVVWEALSYQTPWFASKANTKLNFKGSNYLPSHVLKNERNYNTNTIGVCFGTGTGRHTSQSIFTGFRALIHAQCLWHVNFSDWCKWV